MSLLPVLLLLLSKGIDARLRVSAGPSPLVLPPGRDALLGCQFIVNAPSVDLGLLLVQWVFGEQLLVEYNETVTVMEPRARLCPDELKKGNVSLALADTGPADSGEYTCVVLYGEQRQQGHVTLQVEARPHLEVLNQVVVLEQFSELRCHVTGDYPSNISIQWLRDDQVLEGARLHEDHMDIHMDIEPGLTSSYAFIPSEKDASASYTCRVQHDSLTVPLQETFSLVFGTRPKVRVQDGGWFKKKFLLFLCSVTDFYPEEIFVRWTLNGNPVDMPTQSKKWRDPNGNYSLVESYVFEPYTWRSGGLFACEVKHATIQGTTVETLKLILSPHLPDWVWYVLGVILLLSSLRYVRRRVGDIASLSDWIDGGIVTMECQMKGRVPENITAIWLIKKTGQEQEPEIRENKVNRWSEDFVELVNRDRFTCSNVLVKGGLCGLKRTFTSSLVFQVSKAEDDGAAFVCRFLSADKVLAEKSRAALVLENKAYYSLSGLAVPKECVVGELLILSCSLRGAFPQNTEVTWNKVQSEKRTVIHKDQSGVPAPDQDPSALFYQITENRSENLLISFLAFCPSLQDNEAQFSCRFSDDGGRVNAERRSHALHVVRAKERKPDFCLSSDWGFESTNGVTQEESGV